jgi:gas vesicle protein
MPRRRALFHAPLTFFVKNDISAISRDHLMKRKMSPPQAGAANTTIDPETRERALATWHSIQRGTDTEIAPLTLEVGAASIAETETDTEIAPFIQKVGAASIAEIDRLMDELQEAKNYLLSEAERIEQETVRYANLAQMASDTAKIIFDAVSQWHPASNQRKTNASELTAASTEDNIDAFRKSHHHSHRDMPEVGQAADAPKGTQPLT